MSYSKLINQISKFHNLCLAQTYNPDLPPPAFEDDAVITDSIDSSIASPVEAPDLVPEISKGQVNQLQPKRDVTVWSNLYWVRSMLQNLYFGKSKLSKSDIAKRVLTYAPTLTWLNKLDKAGKLPKADSDVLKSANDLYNKLAAGDGYSPTASDSNEESEPFAESDSSSLKPTIKTTV